MMISEESMLIKQKKLQCIDCLSQTFLTESRMYNIFLGYGLVLQTFV